MLCCSFLFALVLCVLCRDVVVGCGGQLRSVCCRMLLNVVAQATKAALDNWLNIMTMHYTTSFGRGREREREGEREREREGGREREGSSNQATNVIPYYT